MKPTRTLPTGYAKHDAVDFGENKAQLGRSYLLRLVSLAVFLPAFGALAVAFHPQMGSSLLMLVSIEIPGAPALVSILLVVLDVVLVLALHEAVHATVFRLASGSRFHIGVRGPVIFAAAPEWYFGKRWMVANALAPFVVISAVGIVLLAVVDPPYLGWVYIPIVVNAAAAAGDFMLVSWIRRHPDTALYNDTGDATVSYLPSP